MGYYRKHFDLFKYGNTIFILVWYKVNTSTYAPGSCLSFGKTLAFSSKSIFCRNACILWLCLKYFYVLNIFVYRTDKIVLVRKFTLNWFLSYFIEYTQWN